MNWLDDLKIEDLPEPYQEMACMIGVKHSQNCRAFRQAAIIFQEPERHIAERRRRYIIDNFRGDNHAELAR